MYLISFFFENLLFDGAIIAHVRGRFSSTRRGVALVYNLSTRIAHSRNDLSVDIENVENRITVEIIVSGLHRRNIKFLGIGPERTG